LEERKLRELKVLGKKVPFCEGRFHPWGAAFKGRGAFIEKRGRLVLKATLLRKELVSREGLLQVCRERT